MKVEQILTDAKGRKWIIQEVQERTIEEVQQEISLAGNYDSITIPMPVKYIYLRLLASGVPQG